MQNSLDHIAQRYWEIYRSFEGATGSVDLEIETVHQLAEELFYNGQPYSPREFLVNMYYLGKINQKHEKD